MLLSEKLRVGCGAVWGKMLRHPFVLGLGDGTLPYESFRFYMCQDYFFLIEYSRVLAIATAKAQGLETMRRFARLLDATLNAEMELHRDFSAECGIDFGALKKTAPASTTRAYTNQLLRVAGLDDFAAIVTAILPCQWGYSEIGKVLAQTSSANANSSYRKWIEMYASDEFQELSFWLRNCLDTCTSSRDEERLRPIFETSLVYEYSFWQMAFEGGK